MGWGRRPAKTVGTRQDGEMSKGAEVDSSMSERTPNISDRGDLPTG